MEPDDLVVQDVRDTTTLVLHEWKTNVWRECPAISYGLVNTTSPGSSAAAAATRRH